MTLYDKSASSTNDTWMYLTASDVSRRYNGTLEDEPSWEIDCTIWAEFYGDISSDDKHASYIICFRDDIELPNGEGGHHTHGESDCEI